VLLVDKPADRSSHDLVAAAKREHGVKAGHAGTLDPFATGLLIVLLGRRATREQRRFMELPKTYRVLARLGATSTTGDTEGEVTVTGRIPPQDLKLPTGQVRQRPPAFSAVRVRGQRAYRRARRGERLEMPPRLVTVHRFELLRRDAERAELEIECSSGTYVRSLIADLDGDAYCEQLRRTRVGPFAVEEAVSSPLLALEEALERLHAFEDERVRSR
jgi:tRNA pseudouridine55 synthase